ncbi:unnamed protein product [Choristocarpus tenellus]
MDNGNYQDDQGLRVLVAVRSARERAKEGQHAAAIGILLQVLHSVPQLADELEGDLTYSLKEYGEHLLERRQGEKAKWLYSQAIPLLRSPKALHTNFGTLLYSLGQATASLRSFERALEIDSTYWPALESLENVKNLAVDRWHFRMLNDGKRNHAYCRAISRAVAQAKERLSEEAVTVLDIGTGTGILAVFAVRAGASHVYACETNSVLCQVAQEVIHRNGVQDRVTIINKASGNLIPGVDLPLQGVDIVVTELVDSGLLGEKIIPVLMDARGRGLVSKGGAVVPQGALVYAAAMESEEVQKRSTLLPSSPAGLVSEGICMSIEETYTCEDLSRVEHRLLTVPAPVLEVKFLEDGLALWKTLEQEGNSLVTIPPTVSQLPVTASGRTDAIAVWFDLWLDDERGEDNIVSTRPCPRGGTHTSGWDSGIYFSSGIMLREGETAILESSASADRLQFYLKSEAGSSILKPGPPLYAGKCNGRDGEIKDKHEGDVVNKDEYLLGEMDMARLNDDTFHKVNADGVERALRTCFCFRSEMRTGPSTNPKTLEPAGLALHPVNALHKAPMSTPLGVLDLCGSWCLAGILVAHRSKTEGGCTVRVLALADGPATALALNALAAKNGVGCDQYWATTASIVEISAAAITTPSYEDCSYCLQESASMCSDCGGCCHRPEGLGWYGGRDGRVAGSWTGWSVVMAPSLVDGSGLLRQGILGDLEFCRRFLVTGGVKQAEDAGRAMTCTAESQHSCFVPISLEVVCQGIQQKSLLSENQVFAGWGCCGVDISPVNNFGVNTFRELDLTRKIENPRYCQGGKIGENTPLCPIDGQGERVVAGEDEEVALTEPTTCYVLNIAEVCAGADGCLPLREESVPVCRDGTLHGVAFWFKMKLGEADTGVSGGKCLLLNTGSGGEGNNKSHFRQAAVLLEKPVYVQRGQRVEVTLFCTLNQGVTVKIRGVSNG